MSQKYLKDKTVQQRKGKEKISKIASPAMMDICEVECPGDNSPVEMKEGVNNRKYDKNLKMTREKRQNAQMILPLLRWRKV